MVSRITVFLEFKNNEIVFVYKNLVSLAVTQVYFQGEKTNPLNLLDEALILRDALDGFEGIFVLTGKTENIPQIKNSIDITFDGSALLHHQVPLCFSCKNKNAGTPMIRIFEHFVERFP